MSSSMMDRNNDGDASTITSIDSDVVLTHNGLVSKKSKTSTAASDNKILVTAGTLYLPGGLTGQKLFELIMIFLDSKSLMHLAYSSMIHILCKSFGNPFLKVLYTKVMAIHKKMQKLNFAYKTNADFNDARKKTNEPFLMACILGRIDDIQFLIEHHNINMESSGTLKEFANQILSVPSEEAMK